MTRIASRFLVKLGAATLASTSFFASNAFAMGHGPVATIESFVRKDVTLYVSLEAERTPVWASFRLGHGQSWHVSSSPLPRGQTFVLAKGQLLAFVETPSDKNIAHGNAIVSDTRNGIHKTLSVLDYNQYIAIQNNEYAFVKIVHFDKATPVVKVEKKTFAPTMAPQTFVDGLAIDQAQITKTVRVLSGMEPFDHNGTSATIGERGGDAGRKLTYDFITSYYRSLGLESETVCYSQMFYKGCNTQATKWGRDRSKVVLVTSHLDSVRNAGADDNGTGTATVMETARLLANLDTNLSVRFVSFDQEELGLVGSAAYAKQFSRGPIEIVGVVNMDMIGYNSKNDGAIHIMDCDRADSVGLTRIAERVNVDHMLGLKKIDACTDRSDHASFWDHNVPAIVVSENFFGGDSNVCYHKSCDKMDKMHMPYFYKVATLIVNTVYNIAK